LKIAGSGGGVRIRLDRLENDVLTAMLTDFADLVEADAFEQDDPVRVRLFPAGYRDDDTASADFRELTEQSLRLERAQRARECAGELRDLGTRRELVIDAESAQRWIQSINDLRLALGTRLDVTDDDQVGDTSPDAPFAQEWTVYHWLTGLQDSLVRRLMA
jgi:hypothetical protein